MAAVIVPKNSAANAVPDDASISPNSHPYIKVTVSKCWKNEVLRRKIDSTMAPKYCLIESEKRNKNKLFLCKKI